VTLTNSTTAGTTTIRASWSGTISATEGNTDATAATGTAPSDDDATKAWEVGSISVTKNIVFGPFTTSAQVCFTLARDGGGLVTTSTNPQCATITSPTTSHVFTWNGLINGTYSLTETVGAPYTAVAPITGLVVDDTHRTVTAPAQSNPLPLGALRIRKLLNGSETLGTASFTFTVERCGTGSNATTCNTPTAVTGSPFTVNSANNLLTISNLVEAYYRVTETASENFEVQPALSQIVQVTAGNTANPTTVTFDNIPVGDVCVDGKPRRLFMLYNGNGTLNDSHDQASGEVVINVRDNPATRQHPVTIRTYDHQDKLIATFTGVVIGQEIVFQSARAGQLIPARAAFRVFLGTSSNADLNNKANALEHVQFHSSCSQPLARGDEFGSFRLVRDEN
jgi:hypothetical protein